MSNLYRLVYASSNLLVGAEADVAAAVLEILETSQRNNVRHGVTGALMFNGRSFAQVLEGPQQGVEATFERIQRDVRHSDVTVLQCGPVETRGFSNWSMAFVGRSQRGQALWSGMAAESGFDVSRLDGDSVFSMLHSLVLEEEGITEPGVKAHAGPSDRPASERPASAVLPVDQLRVELDQVRPDSPMKTSARTGPGPQLEPGPGAVASAVGGVEATGGRLEIAEAAMAVLKAALLEERQRTTELRHEIDDLRIALAVGRDQTQHLREEASSWAGRTRRLAGTLRDEAEALERTLHEARPCDRDAKVRTARDAA